MSSKIKAGTATSGAVIDADTTGILELQSGSTPTTAVTIDGSQNVGIGTSSPTNTAGYKTLEVTGSSGGIIRASYSTSVKGYYFANSAGVTIGSESNDALLFRTNATEQMRIDSSGNLLVNTTTASAKVSVAFNGSTNNGIALNDTASASGTAFAGFYNNGSLIGSIARVGATSAVVYNTTSDQRLKSNIANASPVLDKLMDVKVRQFDWTDGDLHQDAGFIAQELAPVLSGIVTEGKTEEDMWQVDYSRLTPYLVKAIQELNAKVDAQALEIQALKGVA